VQRSTKYGPEATRSIRHHGNSRHTPKIFLYGYVGFAKYKAVRTPTENPRKSERGLSPLSANSISYDLYM
jgi:hypothetical protein